MPARALQRGLALALALVLVLVPALVLALELVQLAPLVERAPGMAPGLVGPTSPNTRRTTSRRDQGISIEIVSSCSPLHLNLIFKARY